jgi:hypothetical protein
MLLFHDIFVLNPNAMAPDSVKRKLRFSAVAAGFWDPEPGTQVTMTKPKIV